MNSFHVVSEQVTPSEGLRTSSTGKGTLSSVNAVVPLEVLDPGKALGTPGAHRGLDGCVCGDMLPEVVMHREFGRAVITGVWLFTRVRFQMDEHFGIDEEPLDAVWAAKRLFAATVSMKMSYQSLLLREHCRAKVALQGCPTRVRQQVLGQVALAMECLGTMFTGVDRLSAGMLLASGSVSILTVVPPRVPVMELLGSTGHPLNVTPVLAGGGSHFFTARRLRMAGLNVPFKAGFA